MSPAPRQARLRLLALAAAGILALAAGWQAYVLVHGGRERQRLALASGRAEAARIAGTLNGLIQSLQPEVATLAADLSAGRVAPGALETRLEAALGRTPMALGMGVAFAPGARPSPGEADPAPYVERDRDGLRRGRTSGNDAAQNWFLAGLEREGWQEPRLDESTGRLSVGYSRFVRRPGQSGGAPIGTVRMELALDSLRQLLAGTGGAGSGYRFLLSAKGVFLAHPQQKWVLEGRTIFQVAAQTHDPGRWRFGEMAERGERGELEAVSFFSDQPVWLFLEPVPAAHWSLGLAVFRSAGELSPVAYRRAVILLGTTLIALGACLGLAWLGFAPDSRAALWRWQGLVDLLLAGGICLVWYLTLACPDPPATTASPILSQESQDKYLASRDPFGPEWAGRRSFQVPTGVLVQTLRFDGDHDVVATGMAWQRYPADFPRELSRGFVFPSAEAQETTREFTRQDAGGELVGYRFQATLRQDQRGSSQFPFDQTVLSLPLLPRDADPAVSLVPDLDAYPVLYGAALPGLEPGLAVSGWNLERSYFAFIEPNAGINLGSGHGTRALPPPELALQLVLSRKFLGPFLTAVLPVLVVSCLLFTLLLISTGTKVKSEVRAIDIIMASATLLFPVIYAQIALRDRIQSSTLVYLEYFYFLMYALILLVAADAMLFDLASESPLRARINAFTQLLYWPVMLGSLFIISLIFLF